MSVLQKRSSSAGGPPAQAAPTTLANTAKTQSQQRSPTCPPNTHPARTPSLRIRDRAPWGPCCGVQGPPLSRESRSCGRAAYSREIVHFVRPKSAQSFLLQLECGGCGSLTGPDRTGPAADGRADSMALRWGSLKLACCCFG